MTLLKSNNADPFKIAQLVFNHLGLYKYIEVVGGVSIIQCKESSLKYSVKRLMTEYDFIEGKQCRSC